MKELWKGIPNLDGYLASNKGKIYSTKSNKIISQHFNEKGYLRVTLFNNRKIKSYKVHKLIAMTFLSNPNEYSEVNHIDGNKTNNCVENLEWCTHLYNMQEAYRNNLIPPRKVNKTSYKPRKVFQYDLDGNLLYIYNSLKEASTKTNIKLATLSRYCNGQRKCNSYKFKYANE